MMNQMCSTDNSIICMLNKSICNDESAKQKNDAVLAMHNQTVSYVTRKLQLCHNFSDLKINEIRFPVCHKYTSVADE